MESPNPQSPQFGSMSSSSKSNLKGSGRMTGDPLTLTSFNPFSEEDEHDQSSYNLVTSFLSKMKSISAPLSSAVAAASTSSTLSTATTTTAQSGSTELRRPSLATAPTSNSSLSVKSTSDRPHSMYTAPAQVAPPLVSLTPAQSEVPTFSLEYDQSPQRQSANFTPFESAESGLFGGTSIPGFPIPDDTRSIKTATTLHRSHSVSKVMRRIRGEGLSRHYWMDDESAKECYDCKSTFTTWRRKHHCRICGQIFCSRCASRVIKGVRFGHDGMIRVCNLCMEKLANVDDDDDDDRRSVVSSVTFPAHQMGQFGIEHFAMGRHPQSPFAPSQIFRVDEAFNLFSMGDNKRHFPRNFNDNDSYITGAILSEDEEGRWTENSAPFRRAMDDEEDGLDDLVGALTQDDSPVNTSSNGGIDFPSQPLTVDVSSVQFPLGSPDLDTPRPDSRMRNPFYGEYEVATPFIRSRVQSRLDPVAGAGEPGWRTRRESTAYAQELNMASMIHLKIMLRQMLSLEKIPNIKEWEEVLLRLSLRIAKEVTFTSLPHRQGQDMDVRRYVKIKKIPGGTPKDSEYVNGVVITKNVVHKQMARSIHNPRVMLITFPLEFHRVEGQYMHFGQVVRQEKEYLTNLASRIAALRPHIVLVEKSVSRIALDTLVKSNIAVARTVKPSAITTVARMTQGDVFSSMDKLAIESRLGHCSRFRIQTFDHHLIPGRRKSYMRFEGCNRDLGCTIILRGGDIETLRRVKKVTRFLTFVVRNLKLESYLWKDSVISLPMHNPQATPSANHSRTTSFSLASLLIPSSLSHASLATPTVESVSRMCALVAQPYEADEKESEIVDEEEERKRLTQRIDESLEPYKTTFISVSATLRFPPPFPIQRMKELDDELVAAKREWEDEVARAEETLQAKHAQEATMTAALVTNVHELEQQQQQASGEQEDISAQIEALALPLSTTPPTGGVFNPQFYFSPAPLDEGSSYFPPTPGTATPAMSHNINLLLRSSQEHQEERAPLKTAADIQLQSKYSLVKWKHEEHRRIWEWYLRKNKDDFIVEKYQCISMREYTVPMSDDADHKPCAPPIISYMKFYGENDLTLGQFIEKSVHDTLAQFLDPKAICQGKSCNQPLARHTKVFVYNETRMYISVEQWDGQIASRSVYYSPEAITAWSICRECGSSTPFINVSEEVQRYSLAKFLEAYFYPADVKFMQGTGCHHNIYRYHTRYFATRGVTVRFQTEKITLNELVFPPFRIRVRPETQLEIKNSEFIDLYERNNRWYDGLLHDLKQYAIESATGDEEADTRLIGDINALIIKAEAERKDVSCLINSIYCDTPPTDTLVLNQVHAYRQDKIVAWQQDFDRLQMLRPPQAERTSKRVTAFGSMRGIWRTGGPFNEVQAQSSGVSEAEEGPIKKFRKPPLEIASSASDFSEAESNMEKSIESVSEKTVQSTDGGEEPKTAAPPELKAVPPPLPLQDDQQPNEPSKVAGKSIYKEPHDSDPDSDSTIGAAKDGKQGVPDLPAVEIPVSRLSRLPRRTATNSAIVADLVKKYSEYIPPQGVAELSKTALAPPPSTMSESEQEYPTYVHRRTGPRAKNRTIPVRKPSISDFEQSYAVNVAPRYPTIRRPAAVPSRMTGQDSQLPSRRQSPEKRKSSRDGTLSRPESPNPSRSNRRPSKLRVPSRTAKIDKPTHAPPKSASRRPQPPPSAGKVTNGIRHFERLNREVERNKSKYTVLRGKRPRPVVNARAKVEVLESLIGDESEGSDSLSEADDEGGDMDDEQPVHSKNPDQPPSTGTDSPAEPVKEPVPPETPAVTGSLDTNSTAEDTQPITSRPQLPSIPPSPFLAPMRSKQDMPMTPPVSDAELGAEKMPSILRAFSSFLSQANNFLELDDPFGDPEHIFRDSAMVVRLDEPTSIIALALNSPQYREMLSKSRAEKRTARGEAKLMEGSEAFMPDDHSVSDSTSTWGVVNVDEVDAIDPAEDLRVASSKLPWAITFESGGLTISCTVLYPEQFDALRRTYDCEKSIVESLARCVNWNASGGKSGSAFLKTRDDRFIAKELSRAELQTMETFAPAYFDYMSSAVSANRPTLLAKVFGCYKLTFKRNGKDKSTGKNKSTQMNLLVMENLFYDRRFAKIYDLKGSTRNRHVRSTGQENEVLLDENLVEESHKNPFYLREHSKRILRGALYNDSKFLADINVMDYSLVCGVDSKNNELVVGIVDYIRTYTWDKKLESWVKESTFLGGPGKGEPTIVTPKQYRQRFLSATERYFPLVPDRWMKIPDQPEEDASAVLSDLWPDW
ncbi:hypothetical protein FA15DRAFT_667221 [Coprinopsis marcescibilis]|uniref:1-phosphatidylinositol-3-phosphate 5-kinase n=1 Tax=Coprinopsis marcescibilis TaxID=230819 RepID=A0A5C3LE58_COPMA|nr:hypothetical protein FA15DRAFT_667221 [Coprinopsis marcescibilis]